MINTVKVAPSNSLVLVEDVDGGSPPESLNNALIAATDTCVAIGCLSECDGETEISLRSLAELAMDADPNFTGSLLVPTNRLAVRDIYGSILIEAPVAGSSVQLKIWTNHPSEPDRIIIGYA